jgi:hypothetical protein
VEHSRPAASTNSSAAQSGRFLFPILRVDASMALPRVVNSLDSACAAYIAGLIDGEGTITLSRLHRDERRRLVVCISNNELTILQFVLAAVGAGKVTSKRTYHQRHARSYTYQISSRQALGLLKQIAPYLRSYKARRAQLVLKNYVPLTPRNGKYSADVAAARTSFETDLLAIRARS